jgi:hypothetical protein
VPGREERRWNVRITQDADWSCHIAIAWTRATETCPGELCVLMTNLEASGWVLRHYLKRMQIEESFRCCTVVTIQRERGMIEYHTLSEVL